MHASRKLTRRGNALLVALGLALAAGAGLTMRERARTDAAMREVGEAWIAHARAGRAEEAWALLATDARSAHPPAALASALRMPALRAARAVELTGARASSPPATGCLHGALVGAAPDDALTVFLLYEGGRWRVRDVKLYAGEVARGPFACP